MPHSTCVPCTVPSKASTGTLPVNTQAQRPFETNTGVPKTLASTMGNGLQMRTLPCVVAQDQASFKLIQGHNILGNLYAGWQMPGIPVLGFRQTSPAFPLHDHLASGTFALRTSTLLFRTAMHHACPALIQHLCPIKICHQPSQAVHITAFCSGVMTYLCTRSSMMLLCTGSTRPASWH